MTWKKNLFGKGKILRAKFWKILETKLFPMQNYLFFILGEKELAFFMSNPTPPPPRARASIKNVSFFKCSLTFFINMTCPTYLFCASLYLYRNCFFPSPLQEPLNIQQGPVYPNMTKYKIILIKSSLITYKIFVTYILFVIGGQT